MKTKVIEKEATNLPPAPIKWKVLSSRPDAQPIPLCPHCGKFLYSNTACDSCGQRVTLENTEWVEERFKMMKVLKDGELGEPQIITSYKLRLIKAAQ